MNWLRRILSGWFRPQPPAPPPVGPSTAPAFLAALNRWRAGSGLHPLAWDDTLARYAATNRGQHDPDSMGDARGQTWASTHDLLEALDLWKGSAKHAAILRDPSATVVGASPCPSGATANTR